MKQYINNIILLSLYGLFDLLICFFFLCINGSIITYFCFLISYLLLLGIILLRTKGIRREKYNSVKKLGESYLLDFIFFIMIILLYLLIESFLKSKVLLYAELIIIVSSYLAKNVFFTSPGFLITKIRNTSSIKALLRNVYYLILLCSLLLFQKMLFIACVGGIVISVDFMHYLIKGRFLIDTILGIQYELKCKTCHK